MRKILSLALVALLTMPSALRAEAIEIQLMEVIQMGTLPGDDPLDGPDKEPIDPTRPTDFRAAIDGNALSITKEDETIPFAQALVVKASTGSLVLNQQFMNSLQEQISDAGVYVLRIETAGGALVCQFIVQ